MSISTPSIVPQSDDQNVYLVIDDLGQLGRDAETTDLETVITDLLDGQYNKPIRVIAFNTAEGWSRDVSEDIAHELRRRSDLQLNDQPDFLVEFVIRQSLPRETLCFEPLQVRLEGIVGLFALRQRFFSVDALLSKSGLALHAVRRRFHPVVEFHLRLLNGFSPLRNFMPSTASWVSSVIFD
jgi:hypothetical protein